MSEKIRYKCILIIMSSDFLFGMNCIPAFWENLYMELLEIVFLSFKTPGELEWSQKWRWWCLVSERQKKEVDSAMLVWFPGRIPDR